jgi:hypothetical protein
MPYGTSTLDEIQAWVDFETVTAVPVVTFLFSAVWIVVTTQGNACKLSETI